MYPRDPLVKLAHVFLVIARDLNDAADLRNREVINDVVISLRPDDQMGQPVSDG